MPETAGLAVGQQAPSVTVLGPAGEQPLLATYWQQGPLVLTFYHLAFTGG